MLEPRIIIAQLRQKSTATILAALVIGATAWGMVPGMFTFDPEPDTYYFVLPYVFDCSPYEIPVREDSFTRNPIKWWLNCASFQWFDNYKLLPAALGIAIMPLVYILAVSMTNDRLVALVALVAFINNPLYTDWATSGTYDQSWAFFLVLAAVLAFRKKNTASIGSFVIACATKALSAMYMPMYLYTVWRQSKNPVFLMAIIGAVCILGIIAIDVLKINPVGNAVEFTTERWEDAIYRNISIFWQIIPFAVFVLINRNFRPRIIFEHEKTAWVWMIGIFLQNPLIYLFTLQDTYSYRYVPLAAFMSVFIGMTIIQLGNWVVERKLGAGFIKGAT